MHLTTKKENKSLQFLFCCGGEDNNNKTNTVSSRVCVRSTHHAVIMVHHVGYAMRYGTPRRRERKGHKGRGAIKENAKPKRNRKRKREGAQSHNNNNIPNHQAHHKREEGAHSQRERYNYVYTCMYGIPLYCTVCVLTF